jgi:hypothetical protein
MSNHTANDSPIMPTLLDKSKSKSTLRYEKVCDDHGWCIYKIIPRVAVKVTKPKVNRKNIHETIDDLLSDITISKLDPPPEEMELSSQQDTLDSSNQ